VTEIANIVGGRVVGDGSFRVRDVAPLRDATPDELGFLAARHYVTQVPRSRAGALLVAEAVSDLFDDERPRVVVADAHAGLIPLLGHLHPADEPSPGVHPTAVLGQRVSLGAGVVIGPYAVVGDGTVVADRVRIEAHVVVGKGCRIGEDTVLHPGVVLYARTVLGRRVEIHSGARIGVDGFGYAQMDGGLRKVPQVGRVVVGDDVEIGANACIDRGSIGDTVVSEGSKLDNLVHLAHNVQLGMSCALAAQTGIAGSTRLGNGVMCGGQVGISGHLELGDGVSVAAQAGVTSHVDAGSTVMGYPARDMQEYLKAYALTFRLGELRREVRALRKQLDALEEGVRDGLPDRDG
jgi:UDP-3-O-[3-hydroxymyristoyl] glucosamine N-acyltransferase